MKDPLPLRWICCCCPCGPKPKQDPAELERGGPGDVEFPPTTTKLEDDNAYIAEVAINMALRRSTETAERHSMETAVPTRDLDPPPTYDSVWTEPSGEMPVERDAGHVAQSGPTPVNPAMVLQDPAASHVRRVPVASHEPAVHNDMPKPVPTPAPVPAATPTPQQEQHEEVDVDSDYESRLSTPRTLTPPMTVPPTLADADEDEERRRWIRDDRGGVRRA